MPKGCILCQCLQVFGVLSTSSARRCTRQAAPDRRTAWVAHGHQVRSRLLRPIGGCCAWVASALGCGFHWPAGENRPTRKTGAPECTRWGDQLGSKGQATSPARRCCSETGASTTARRARRGQPGRCWGCRLGVNRIVSGDACQHIGHSGAGLLGVIVALQVQPAAVARPPHAQPAQQAQRDAPARWWIIWGWPAAKNPAQGPGSSVLESGLLAAQRASVVTLSA